MPAPRLAEAASQGMSTGQLITWIVIAVLFVGFAIYVLVIRPKRKGPRPLRADERRALGLKPARPEDDDEAMPDPEAEVERAKREEADRRREEDALRDPSGRGAARDDKKRTDAEADFRRREADERRRRAEEDKRRAEEDAIDRRKSEAERKRKTDEERKKKKEEEERARAEEERKKREEEEAKRAAEEAVRKKKQEELSAKRERLKALKDGLEKTRDEGFVGKMGALFAGKQLDEQLVGDLEEIMFTADIGVKTADTLFQRVKEGLSRKELANPAAVFRCLHEEASRILDVGGAPPRVEAHKPYVIMVIGVNGSGKTTTIGKLAAQYKAKGKKVVLGAGDTFRAAATEQLAVWAQRSDVPIVRGTEGADPSSVLFNAVQEAKKLEADVVIADTAGRLQTKIPLMEELKKIHRVLGKGGDGAPHEVLLVLDSTNGQNAISQAKLFNEALKISGIVMTKLDGTAKGGVILGIVDELKVPVRYIGIGESIEDLKVFDKEDFLDALFEIRDVDDPA